MYSTCNKVWYKKENKSKVSLIWFEKSQLSKKTKQKKNEEVDLYNFIQICNVSTLILGNEHTIKLYFWNIY